VGALTADAMNVPMIVDLDETEEIEPWIITQGAQTNTWFRVLENK
jgi:hypothetical protein